jgi:hypothetical protein
MDVLDHHLDNRNWHYRYYIHLMVYLNNQLDKMVHYNWSDYNMRWLLVLLYHMLHIQLDMLYNRRHLYIDHSQLDMKLLPHQ